MDAAELARQAADELAQEFKALGPEIRRQTDLAIQGKLPEPEKARDWGTVIEAIHTVGDVTHTVHFLMIITPLAITKWRQLKNVAAVRAAVAEIASQHAFIGANLAAKIIRAVVRQLHRSA